MAALATQPVITGVSIPNVSMKINDVVTATIFVQSDSATVYTLNASNIGGYALSSLSKQNSTTYTATFTVIEGGLDHAAGSDIPTSVTLADGVLTNTWTTAISQANDPIDANRPTDPTLSSSSHTVSVWDNDDTVDTSWSGATDATSGVAGYSFEWSTVAGTVPDMTQDTAHGTDPHTTTSAALADGNSHYFHLRTVDNAGNWTDTVHLGPFYIDTTTPSVPANLSPTSGTYTNDISPTLSWDASADTGGSGMRDTNTYRVIVTGPPNKDYYTANTTYTPTLAEGVFTWKIYSRDNAGNNSNYTANHTLTIDTTQPDVTIDQAGAQADPTNSSPVVFTAVFDEAINTGTFTNADVTIGGTATTGAVTVSEIAPNDGTTFSVSVVATADGTVTATIPAGGVEDLAGNTNTASTSGDNTVTYDTTPPQVSGVTAAPTQIADATAGVDKFTVTTVFSETMNTGTTPTLTFTPDVRAGGTPTLSNGSGVWTQTTVPNDTFTMTYDVADRGIDIDSVTVEVSGAKDAAGNDQQDYTPVHEFDIDTLNPTVEAVTPAAALINDAVAAGGTFTVEVEFSETMDTGTQPAISFAPSVASTLSFDHGAWSMADFANDTYTATYNVTDASVEIDDVAVDVTGAKDAAGDDQQDYAPEIEFNIDTLNPTVTSMSVNDTQITDSDAGSSLRVTVDFSEAMDQTVNPVIIFDPAVATTLMLASTEWENVYRYRADYVISDGNVDVDSVTIDVTGAKDAAKNDQQNYAPVHEFEIDTLNPTITSITSTTPNDYYNLGSNINVTVAFSEQVALVGGTLDVTLDASADVVSVLTFGPATSTSATYTVGVEDNSCDLDATNIVLDGGTLRDNAGNDAVIALPATTIANGSDITVDNTNPVINDLVVDDHVLVSADCCETTVYFTANVTDNCCIVADNVAVTVTLPTNNAILENIAVSRVQNGQGRVDITGSTDIRCLTSCPARVEVYIEATDCCGNNAITVTSTATEGRAYDETAPEPKDDRFRLMVRADDTLFQLDVMQNDTDNCSSCTCCGTMWIHDIVASPEHGTATIEIDPGNGGSSICYSPDASYFGRDEFTYRIVDTCGNVSSVATVFVNLIAETVMDDIYLTTCANNSLSFEVGATDPWINPINPDEIPFVFSIVTSPLHGVVSGDLGDVTYAAHGGIELATITLVYTPAAGFTGHDALTLRFADPFGGSSTAVVDITVLECAEQPGAPPLFALQQGEIFPLIVPLTFSSVYEKEWHTITVQAIDATGTLYNEALSATWEESINRYVLRLDTASLPPGLYQMMIPLGNGETVTLMIEVGKAI